MKLNNRGFAISSVMYIILVLAVIIISLTLALLSGRKLVLDKLKVEVYDDIYSEICTLKSGEPKAIGSKYECEVKEGVKYNFYVLSQEEDGTTNLILDRNINSDGTLATEALTKENAKNGVYNLVAWHSSNQNSPGPITAMNFLYNATKNWTNIPNIQMDYEDEGNTGSYGYGKIVTTNNVTKITKKDGSAVTVLTDKEGYANLKARLPYKSEVSKYDSTNKTNAYLYDYLELYNNIQTNPISGIYGYWTLSSSDYNSTSAWYVRYDGFVLGSNVGNGSGSGVRPVINVILDTLDEKEEEKPEPVSFTSDSWETIAKNVKVGNLSKYKVGDRKEIALKGFTNGEANSNGLYTVRIANISSDDSVCKNDNYSKTACGFVIEFEDIITTHVMNPEGEYKGTQYSYGWNVDGWPASSMRTYVNNDIYNALPEELKSVIIPTKVVSGHGSTSGETNFVSEDKVYLLSTKEVWGKKGTSGTINFDTAEAETRQLDYYNSIGVTTSSSSGAIKKLNGSVFYWWLRSAYSNNSSDFYSVYTNGVWSYNSAYSTNGVAVAFRIG